ncbi:MAG: hypothetical protein A3J35_07250 [Gammaproteobacteria bacterium RIFCSPLOWO2_02_FULL_52_10]|nr:MAG: hypothetical protein A3J35_07250 [Gammaproteobacteria bacterium RIFCSPLOWO2_02_FULL_52_10]
MIKAITLIRRKSGLTVREFQEYWRHEHVKAIARLPGIRRYVQNHPLPENYVIGMPVCDGVAELWGEDTRTFRDMASSEAYQRVQADEEQFIDRQSLQLILTSETVLNAGSPQPGGIKFLEFLQRRGGQAVEDFQHYWLAMHGPLVSKLSLLRRYVQSPARPGGYSADYAPAFDALSSMWFDAREDFQLTMESGPYATIIADRINFLRNEDISNLICEEQVIIG